MEYNSLRPALRIKEYGRHIQKMIAHIQTMEDTEERQKAAETVIHTMLSLHPELKSLDDYQQKLWDHLFIIADFNLPVKSPFPLPQAKETHTRPAPMPYPQRQLPFPHLGKGIENLIRKAVEEKDAMQQQLLIHIIIQAMRQIYINKHKEHPASDVLKAELLQLSNGALTYTKNTAFIQFLKSSNGGGGARPEKRSHKDKARHAKHARYYGKRKSAQ